MISSTRILNHENRFMISMISYNESLARDHDLYKLRIHHVTNYALSCRSFYLNSSRVLTKLAQSFHDSDKKDNYRREYINLIQESKKFSDFFNQFQRLYIYLKYQKNVLVINLKNKINSCL